MNLLMVALKSVTEYSLNWTRYQSKYSNTMSLLKQPLHQTKRADANLYDDLEFMWGTAEVNFARAYNSLSEISTFDDLAEVAENNDGDAVSFLELMYADELILQMTDGRFLRTHRDIGTADFEDNGGGDVVEV